MNGKVVLITGAKGGLGTSVTQAFLAAGATVVGVSRSIKQSDFPNPGFVALEADVSSRAAAVELAKSVVARFSHIDVLAHVVGGFAGGASVAETDQATWDRMRDLNFNSALYIAAAVIPQMHKQGYGRIIGVGSKAAEQPHAGLGAYVVFKTAMVALFRTIALENGDAGMTANVILPGTMDTPANRASDPKADFSKWMPTSDVANVIVWLAGDAAAKVNGAVISVAGHDV
jgi:NAD(P)-dependent dehydrogenase (short-subunit alcohol dehydrogenase family)